MSFYGKQYRGAMRDRKPLKRKEAEVRNALVARSVERQAAREGVVA